MTEQNLQELAKQGNTKAIAYLLGLRLQSQGIAVKIGIKRDCLIVFLESDQVPEEQTSVEFIQKEVEKLRIAFLHTVKVYARQKGENSSAWIREFKIEAPAELALPLGCTLRQANSKDRLKILLILLFPNTILMRFDAIFLLLCLYTFLLDRDLIFLVYPITSFLIRIVQIIINYLWDMSNVWLVECNNLLIAYGVLVCPMKVQMNPWYLFGKNLSILLANIISLYVLPLSFMLYIFKNLNLIIIFSLIASMPFLIGKIQKWSSDIIGNLKSKEKFSTLFKKSYIQTLFVVSDWRRKGIGSALVQRLIQEATLPLYVNSLPDKVSFYTRLGFTPLRSNKKYRLVPLVYQNNSRAL